jgi:hypothetical protein
MKVFLNYEDNDNPELYKSIKITLPKSWKTGPTQKLVDQFVETYNSNETLGSANPLDEKSLHLAIRKADENGTSHLVDVATDAVVIDVIPDRTDVYIMHGPGKTLAEYEAERKAQEEKEKAEMKDTVQCTHFGCKKRFPKGKFCLAVCCG